MKIDSSSRFSPLALKRRSSILLAAFLSLASCAALFASGTERKSTRGSRARRALVISIDGLDARYLKRRDEYGLKIPNLRRLMAEGAWAEGVTTVYPSVTYPAHTTIVTGAYPSRHGILGNEALYAPVNVAHREWYWYARDIRAETLWDAARQKGLKVGMVSWPVGVGAGDYNVPEIIRFGGALRDTLKRIRENAVPEGLLDEIEKRDRALYAQASRDEQDDMRTRLASYLITEKRPDLVFVHLLDLDHFEHERGPFTPDALAIVEKADAYLGRLLDAARAAGTLSDTAVFIVSDHGFMPISKLFHPGVLLERAGLLKVREERDEKGEAFSVITEWRAMPFVTNGSCAIILKDENDREALRRVREIFGPLAGREGVRDVFEGKALRVLNANPRAALMMEAADGFAFGPNYTGDVITASKDRGAHGYLPQRPDYYASFVAAGPGINHQQLPVIRMIDVGPTIASVLGLSLRDAEGQSLRLEGRRK